MGCRQSTPIADINMFRIRSTRWPTDDDDDDDDAAEEDFSPMLEESTVSVISNVAVDVVKYQSLPFNSFHDAASEFLKANSDTLNNISKLKDEISSNPDLVDFVTKHLNNNIETLDFLTAIKISIQKARDAERLVDHAIVHFDHHNHEAALKKLLQFNEEGNPFTEECIEKFKDAIKRHNSILEDLHLRKNELTKKDNVKIWRKVWKIVYYAAFATVLISAFVLAALAAPMAIIAPFTVAASAMPPLKELVNWVLNKFQSPHDGEGEAISSLKDGTDFAIHELNNIKGRVEELMTNNIEPKADSAKLTIEEKEALQVAMVDIKFMAKTFVKSVDVLEKEVDQHIKELKKRTVTILEKFPDSLKKKKKFGIPIIKNIKKNKSNSRKKSGKKSTKRN